MAAGQHIIVLLSLFNINQNVKLFLPYTLVYFDVLNILYWVQFNSSEDTV